MYCSAKRMRSTATTIHGHGLRAKRFTGLSRPRRRCCSPARGRRALISRVFTRMTTVHVIPNAHCPLPRSTHLLRERDLTPALYAGRPGSAVDVGSQRADVAQVAVLLPEVEAVSDDEIVGYVPPDVLHLQRHLSGLRLAQQRTDLHAGGVADGEVGGDPALGEPGLDDLVDDQHVPTGDVGVEVLEDPHHPAGLRA